MSEESALALIPSDAGDSSSTAALLTGGATIMRIENETMQALAVQQKRDPKRVLKACLEELEIAPSLAVRNYYSIPYKDRQSGKTTMVEGQSINAARILMRNWGNAAAKTVITGEDADKIFIAGIFTDLECNVRFERVMTVSKWQHRKGGAPVKLAAQTLDRAIQAGASKAERNAILAGIPDWLKHSYYQRSRQIAATDVKENQGKLLEAFLELGVTRDMLEKHLGCALERVTDDQLADLRGIYNALRDKERSVDDIFGEEQAAEDATVKSVDDILSTGASITSGTIAGGKK